MAEFPGFTLWTDAYLGDTGHLTTLEHGAYLLLLIAMWRNGGTLPNDDKRLARFAHLGFQQWARIKSTMMEFMTVQGECITQGRLMDELVFVQQRRQVQSNNARAKSRKTKNTHIEMAQPNASQTSAPTLTPTLSKKEPSLRSGTKALGTRLSDDWVLPKPFGDYAMDKGLPRDRILIEAQKMKDWSINSPKLGVKVDWFAAWRTWVQKAIDDLPRLPGHAPPPGPKPGSIQAEFQRRREIRNADREAGSLIDAPVLLLRDNTGG